MKRPVRQLKRSESIARLLVDRITSSRLKDGDSLESEIVMMEELNTGRGSLREAFRILELSGILEVRTGPTGGPIVRDPDISHFAGMWSLFLRMNGGTYRELMEANIITEPPIAAIGAQRRNPEHIAVLQAAVELRGGDPRSTTVTPTWRPTPRSTMPSPGWPTTAPCTCTCAATTGSRRSCGATWSRVGEVQGEVHDAHKHVFKAIVDGNPRAGRGGAAQAPRDEHASTASSSFGSMLDQPVRWH